MIKFCQVEYIRERVSSALSCVGTRLARGIIGVPESAGTTRFVLFPRHDKIALYVFLYELCALTLLDLISKDEDMTIARTEQLRHDRYKNPVNRSSYWQEKKKKTFDCFVVMPDRNCTKNDRWKKKQLNYFDRVGETKFCTPFSKFPFFPFIAEHQWVQFQVFLFMCWWENWRNLSYA